MKKNLSWVAIAGFSLFVAIAGCTQKNPMMTEAMIGDMKAHLFLDGPDFPIRQCAHFYAGDGNTSAQQTCDQWSQTYFKSLLNNGNLPSNTTLDEFRSAEFWKAVEPQ